MKGTYYRIQLFTYSGYASILDERWISRWNEFFFLKDAEELYRDVCREETCPVRLVKAFISEYSGEERILEVLQYRKARK